MKLSCKFTFNASFISLFFCSFRKLTNLIKQRENTKKALLECSLNVFQTRYVHTLFFLSRLSFDLVYFHRIIFRCELNATDDEITVKQRSTTKVSNNSLSRIRPDLKPTSSLSSAWPSSSSLKTSSPQQQLLAQLIRLEQQKKTTKPILATSSQSIADLLQTPLKSLSSDLNESSEQKTKRFKSSHRPSLQVKSRTKFIVEFHVMCILSFDRPINSHNCYHHQRTMFRRALYIIWVHHRSLIV